MRKSVCYLYEQGVYYGVYEENGSYIKENIETGEQSNISLNEYGLYRLAGYLNDSILAQKGVINEENPDNSAIQNTVSSVLDEEDEPSFAGIGLDSADLDDEFEFSFLNEVKANVDASSGEDIDEDEKTLRELEAIIEASIAKDAEKQQKSEEKNEESVIKHGTLYDQEADPSDLSEYAFLGLASADSSKKNEELENEYYSMMGASNEPLFPGYEIKDKKKDKKDKKVKKEKKEKKESFLHRIISSRPSKVKREKVKKEKIKKEKVKKEKVKKELAIPIKPIKVKKQKVRKAKPIKIKRVKRVFSVRDSRPVSSKKMSGKTLTILAAVALGLVILTAGANKAYTHYKENLGISFEFNQEESRMSTIKETFNKVINGNKTISDTAKEDIYYYLNILYSYQLSDETYERILNNINKYDLSGVANISVIELNTILAGNPNATMIAHELYNYKNDISYLSITKYQWVADVISLSEDATRLLLDGKDVNAILKAVFNIDDNLDLSTQRLLTNEGNGIKEYIEQLKAESFGNVTSSCELENNIFSPYIKIYDNNVQCYLYFDKTTRKGISESIYTQKLQYMLDTRVDELDYTDVRDRELLYFYANALLDSNNVGFNSTTELIMNGLNSNYHVFDIFDLMRYLSGSEINHVKAAYLYSLITYGEDALPLLQEINMCLKLDVKDGLIEQATYDAFIENLNLGLDLYAPEMKDEFNRVSSHNQHFEGYSLKIFGTQTL